MESIARLLKKEYLSKLYDAWRASRRELEKIEADILSNGGNIPSSLSPAGASTKAPDLLIEACKALYYDLADINAKGTIEWLTENYPDVPVNPKTVANTLARLEKKKVLKIKTPGVAGISATIYDKHESQNW